MVRNTYVFLFVYTDGVPDAINGKEEAFERERMLQALNEAADDSPEVLVTTVKAEIDNFVGKADQFDDITMLALRMN